MCLPAASSRAVLALGVVISLTLASAATAAAQEVRGAVRLEESGDAVGTAIVELLNDGGGAVARTLTDVEGRFRMRAPAAGRYRIGIERIGLAATTTEAFDVGDGDIVVRDVVVGMQPISLAGIEVARTSRCAIHRDAPVSVQRIWDEARKTLHAVSLFENTWAVSFRVRRWERDLDPESGAVRREQVRQSIVSQALPFGSVPAEVLLTEGFIRNEGDSTAYHAPDAGVLLSDAFLEAYCFRAVMGDSGRVGLAFEPVNLSVGQKIKGVLWLDRVSAALHELEYVYTNVPSASLRLRTGGSVAFDQLANGAWIVSRWNLRMPRYAIVNGVPTDRIMFVHETGGEVLDASLAKQRLTLRSVRPAPSVARVSTETTGATTDTVVIGEHAVVHDDVPEVRAQQALHAQAESARARDEALERTAEALRVRAAAAAAARAGTHTGRVVGTVVDAAERRPVANAAVRVAGTDTEATTDGRGRFWLETPASLVTLQFEHVGYETAKDTLHVRPGELVRVDVQLGPIALAPINVTARRTGLLADVYWRATNHIGGIFITDEQIRKRAPRFGTDMLRDQSGIRMWTAGSGRTGQITFRGECAPSVYLDGIRMTNNPNPWSSAAMSEAFDAVNMIHPWSIEIMEVYRGASEVPGDFGGSRGGCGAIAIWTQRGG